MNKLQIIDTILKEARNIKLASKKPSIFSRTIYCLPTKEELEEVDSFNLNADSIYKGFYYTMVGRGFLNQENKDLIMTAIGTLVKMYPGNSQYPIALEKAKVEKIKSGPNLA